METFGSTDVLSQETFCYGDVLYGDVLFHRRFSQETFCYVLYEDVLSVVRHVSRSSYN
jgi:hypothetical protein